jgi:hypothetical protein
MHPIQPVYSRYASAAPQAFRLRKFGVKDIATAAISVDVHTPAGSSAGVDDAEATEKVGGSHARCHRPCFLIVPLRP